MSPDIGDQLPAFIRWHKLRGRGKNFRGAGVRFIKDGII